MRVDNFFRIVVFLAFFFFVAHSQPTGWRVYPGLRETLSNRSDETSGIDGQGRPLLGFSRIDFAVDPAPKPPSALSQTIRNRLHTFSEAVCRILLEVDWTGPLLIKRSLDLPSNGAGGSLGDVIGREDDPVRSLIRPQRRSHGYSRLVRVSPTCGDLRTEDPAIRRDSVRCDGAIRARLV